MSNTLKLISILFVGTVAQQADAVAQQADAVEREALTFAETPTPYVIGSQAHATRWSYFVTRGVSLFPITNADKVRRYLDWSLQDDASACQLSTRGNYVALVRRVPDSLRYATHLSWTWQVQKDTPRGLLGARPDDQALQVILIYRWEDPERYCAVSYAWTRDDQRDAALYTTRLPQDNFPRVQVAVRRLRSGRQDPRDEKIDVRQAYLREAEFHGEKFTSGNDTTPTLFALALFGESSNQRPPVNPRLMSTKSLVRDVVLSVEGGEESRLTLHGGE